MSETPTPPTTAQKIEEGAKETAVAAAGYGKRFAEWAGAHPALVGSFALGLIVGFVIGTLWPH